ncbi:type I-U CRISPR-associated protein Cas7 [Actinomyces lilanjuaniae]|uniref:Type I-U CRISPR-associated protein Cas7 n=1 Tax=Actinomyces lilanjuaniae TaxID=2321394 RepID=A0ABN5PPP6_9ACTO|nr:type I-U CRISPR-associated RAMP protein Csb1/Cas7u [Actinomyces lilanjuaniae]AYD88984.1 type I-U CRISPR-associated protein Cas7 [Actinomyces lilanjuaniae]
MTTPSADPTTAATKVSADEFRHLVAELAADTSVAGITLTGRYESLTGHTVTPPAGTIRQKGEEVGIFRGPEENGSHGETMATIDSWGSVVARCEALLAGPFGEGSLADYLGFPLVVFVDDEGTVLTTSVELSHRQADATWRLAHDELIEAGVDFDAIQQASRKEPTALLTGFPTAIPFGWWHSQTKRSQKAADKANEKSRSTKKNGSELEEGRDKYLGYYAMNPADSRSARLFTAEFLALGVKERRRAAAKVDALFAAVSEDTKIGGNKLSTVGLGSIPPTDLTTSASRPGPYDLTYRAIESHAFFSLTGLRTFRFLPDPEPARVLTVALTLLLYSLLQHNLSLRAGTELRLCKPGLDVQVQRHGAAPEAIRLPDVDELAGLVRDLGAEVGWEGPRVVRIGHDSPLGKIILAVDGQKS